MDGGGPDWMGRLMVNNSGVEGEGRIAKQKKREDGKKKQNTNFSLPPLSLLHFCFQKSKSLR
jgi:hypothetical protein